MRRIARIGIMAFWLLSAASASGKFQRSSGKEAKIPEPPACPAKFDDSLETDGIVHDFKNGVTPPKATVHPEAEFSKEARKEARKQHLHEFVSILSMVVGVDGVPRDVCFVKAAGYDLDAKAAEAAWKYRFVPAVKDGKPVPARVTMEVNFRLY